MSFDVAVWEGPRPADEVQTQAEFARRCDAAYARVEAGLAPAQVTPRLRAFIADARRYYPDGDRDVDRVWADGRLSEGVDGGGASLGSVRGGSPEGRGGWVVA